MYFLIKKRVPRIIAGIDIINDSKRDEINIINPINIKITPPSCSYFQAMAVKIIKMKLGIKCIIKARNHCGSTKTSRANRLIKTINKIARIRGDQYKTLFIFITVILHPLLYQLSRIPL